ncbi:MAG: hypothetical protein KGI27_10135 [Thaumarchaeota archaeon]|nr:hypothetical protein [Nitrososphaerota archaeon]
MSITIYSHSYKPPAKFFGTPYLGVYLGVELELDIEGWMGDGDSVRPASKVQDLLGDLVYFKHDGSISGVEIVTHPASLQVHRSRWKKFFKGIPKDFVVRDRDGMHVHFTRKDLTRHQVWQIHNFINSQTKRGASDGTRGCTGDGAKWLVKLAGRDFNTHACRLIKPEISVNEATAKGKYEAVNCTPSATVEVRLFAATLDYQEFMLRLEFVAALVQAVQLKVDPLTVQSLKDFLCKHPKRFPVLVPWLAKEGEL